MFAEFHFLRPIWLLALFPALVIGLLLYWFRREQSPWHSLIAAHLQPVLLSTKQALQKQPMLLPTLLLCWLISVVALAGPSWHKLPQPAFALKKATVLVLDMSMSMRATDMLPDRLTQQRFKALDLAQQLKEGELGLLSFAGDAFIIAPLTPDHNNISLLIPDLQPEIMPVQGSNLLAALQQADKLLTQAGYPRGDVVVFTDGFDDNSYLAIQKLLNNWPHRLSILGFGTTDGAPIKLANGELLKNGQGAVVLPKLPQQQLASLAKRHGGIYANASIDGQGLADILAQSPLSALDTAEQLQQIKGDQWQDGAIYLVWLLIPILLWQRRFGAMLTLALFMLPMPQVQANTLQWRDLWQTQQQQAEQDYNAGDFTAAKEKFADPLWQGNAAYRAGDYQTAEQAYRHAATERNTPQSWHNLGNSLAQQQRYADAATAYEQALALQPDMAEAADNAKLMQQLLQQQAADNNSDSEQDKQQDSEQQQSSEQDSEQGSNENTDNNSEQNQDNQQSTEQNNNSSQENAEANASQQKEASEQQQDAEQQALEQQKLAEADDTESSNDEQKQQQAAITEAWPDASPEQQQQLNNLLRKVQDDPALLLRNKMYLEYQKRQHQRLPKGVEQQW
ncbi:VWA domain-containing protein [Rheinheimera salexigens]|uniref:Colicin transporter n=1 Tax=Rheinheimera salexigens TaxID=1628148 RepID=A0A1E7Q726_9GAMM|nr:VWA domain-containing protein [Rheinheimera salexigens]OEY69946.1 colicin transporter [Rheinheimera salexigens]